MINHFGISYFCYGENMIVVSDLIVELTRGKKFEDVTNKKLINHWRDTLRPCLVVNTNNL